MAAELRERLSERMAGKRALFITLTYDRSKLDHHDPLELYREQREQQHVVRFLEALGRRLWHTMPADQRPRRADGRPANPLVGRWIRKLEFQRGGWTHFHILLEWEDKIPHEWIRECWGRGRTDIKRATAQRVRYFAKYLSKDAPLPQFLLGERPRSVKIVACSPGFWNNTEPSEPSPKRPQMPFWVPLGELMRLRRLRTEFVGENGYRKRLNQCVDDVLNALLAEGGTVTRRIAGGWICGTGARALVRALGGRELAAKPPAAALPLLETTNPRHRWTNGGWIDAWELQRASEDLEAAA